MIALSRLRADLNLPADPVDAGRSVTAVAYDSRRVRPGTLFVAVPGFHVDGHAFLGAAVAAGAVALVTQADAPRAALPAGVPVLRVPDTRAALAEIAAAFYGNPARSLRVIGVTGTDGKTTTTYLTSAVLEAGGFRTGLMGTVQHKVGAVWRENDSRQTTPESLEVQALLAEMRDNSVSHAVIESSSHGLELHKLDGCDFDIAVVTNVGVDHLDLHGTPAAYLAAKGRLFQFLDSADGKFGPRAGVVNADDPASAAHMRGRTRAPVLAYGIDTPAEVRAERVRITPAGTDFTLATPVGRADVRLRLPGRFNVSNALAAASVAHLEGISPEVIAAALGGIDGVPGRMQRIEAGQPFGVVVDYAHTGPAFEKALHALRAGTSGRLIAVFGCAGSRSPERREAMGAVAARLADFSVLTNEDPHEEEPGAILAAIAAALSAGGRQEAHDFLRIEDRRTAIRAAFQRARPGDLVLLAGKGHEQSIVFGRVKTPWDEASVAREELAALGFSAPPAGESPDRR